MADIDTNANNDGKTEAEKTPAAAAGETPEQKAAKAKIEADAAAAKDKETKDAAAEAEREAADEKRIKKLADKRAAEMLAAKEAEAKTKAEREKMDVADKAKAEAKEANDKLAAMEARTAAAELKAELAGHLVTKALTPANPQALDYIQAAVKREMDAGAENVAAAVVKVQKSEPFLFKQPEAAKPAAGAAAAKPVDTDAAAAGATDRAAPAGGGGTGARQYRTKDPKDIDIKDRAAIADSIQERHGFRPALH